MCLADRVRKIDEQVLSHSVSQTNSINFMPCLGMSDDHPNEILGHMMPFAPVLSKSKDKVRYGRLRVDKGIVLESGTEVISVVSEPPFQEAGPYLLENWHSRPQHCRE